MVIVLTPHPQIARDPAYHPTATGGASTPHTTLLAAALRGWFFLKLVAANIDHQVHNRKMGDNKTLDYSHVVACCDKMLFKVNPSHNGEAVPIFGRR